MTIKMSNFSKDSHTLGSYVTLKMHHIWLKIIMFQWCLSQVMLDNIMRLLRGMDSSHLKLKSWLKMMHFNPLVMSHGVVILSNVDTSWHDMMLTNESEPLVYKEETPHENKKKWECKVKAFDGCAFTLLLDTCACSLKSFWKALHTPGCDISHVA